MNAAFSLFVLLLLLRFSVESHPYQQHPILPAPLPPPLRPYTKEWVAALEHFRNTAGGDCDDDDDACPLGIPVFDCVRDGDDDDYAESENNVWSLRPQDVKAVITLGDSISAGFGMLSGRPPLTPLLEYRGKAFSSGADHAEYTLPNFLRVYDGDGNPPAGAPEGVTLPLAHRKELNFAVSGSLSDDLPAQASRLITALSDARYAELRGGFKLVTILIGANNLCQACSNLASERARTEPDAFERDVRITLEKLRTGAGLLFVNLVGLFNVSNVHAAAQEDAYCRLLFDRSNLALCPCATESDETREYADSLTVEYNRRLQRVAADYGPGRSKRFAVVYQPALEALSPDAYGQAFLSRFDCFHPNRCAHRVIALGVWNNMFSPPGLKLRVGTGEKGDDLKPICPRKGDFLQ